MTEMFEIDVSGPDIFEKNYSIAIVYNGCFKYGFRFDKGMQKNITMNYQREKYCIDSKHDILPK